MMDLAAGLRASIKRGLQLFYKNAEVLTALLGTLRDIVVYIIVTAQFDCALNLVIISHTPSGLGFSAQTSGSYPNIRFR